MEIAIISVHIFYLYLLVGTVFAILFLFRGAARLDAAAQGISWKTSLLLFPGSVALWPVLLRKWLLASKLPQP